jgi:hypothetical protein
MRTLEELLLSLKITAKYSQEKEEEEEEELIILIWVKKKHTSEVASHEEVVSPKAQNRNQAKIYQIRPPKSIRTAETTSSESNTKREKKTCNYSTNQPRCSS